MKPEKPKATGVSPAKPYTTQSGRGHFKVTVDPKTGKKHAVWVPAKKE